MILLVESHDQGPIPCSDTHVAMNHEADGTEHFSLGESFLSREHTANPLDQRLVVL